MYGAEFLRGIDRGHQPGPGCPLERSRSVGADAASEKATYSMPNSEFPADSPRAQLQRARVARAVRALHDAPTVDAVPDEVRDCYRRHGEVLAERDALLQRVAELEAERDALAKSLREALTYDQFADL